MTQQEIKELQKANAARWETLPPVHPAALIFPMMGDAEIDETAADIKKNGLRVSAVFWEDNSEAKNGAQGPFPLFLLDGRNRIEALRRLGGGDYIKPDRIFSKESVSTVRIVKAIRQKITVTIGGAGQKPKWVKDVDPWEFVMSMNAHRRHLTAEQKREAIAVFIKNNPQASDRKAAKALKVSDHTVADVRKETVPNSQNANLEHKPIERAKTAVRENPSASASEIAKTAGVGKSTAQRAKKRKNEGAKLKLVRLDLDKRRSPDARINEWIARAWKAYKNQTVSPELFKVFIVDVLAEAPATLSVMSDALKAFKFDEIE